ncbi:MAG TPA: ABC transporter ATP-binding protein [Thermomicrobiales bacterium]|nr:ABC transporter ATP-binding protein [Thermomicrobiales bacterium]
MRISLDANEGETAARTIIDVTAVSKSYQTGRRDIIALHDVNLRIESGEWVAIVGPSGCGKSTLLNLLAGIDTPDNGDVVVSGTSLAGMSQDALAAWRGRAVGIVFQFFQLMPTLTSLENVMLPMDLAGEGHNRRARARELLERVGIGELAANLPSELSGGEQQRVAIARALANDPALLLADEPTGNLDSRNGTIVVDLLEDVWRRGATVVMVTHDPQVAERAQRVVTMRDGQVCSDQARVVDALRLRA